MSAPIPRCPRCESLDVAEKAAVVEAADRDDLHATHECLRCRTPFRPVPPPVPFNPPRFAGHFQKEPSC